MDSWDIPLESDLEDIPPESSGRPWFLHHSRPSLRSPPVSKARSDLPWLASPLSSHLASLGSLGLLPCSARLALSSRQERSVSRDPLASSSSITAVTTGSSSGYLGTQPGV